MMVRRMIFLKRADLIFVTGGLINVNSLLLNSPATYHTPP